MMTVTAEPSAPAAVRCHGAPSPGGYYRQACGGPGAETSV
jgi:hypothetical protein